MELLALKFNTFCFVSIFALSFKLIVQKAIIKYYRFIQFLLLDALIGHSADCAMILKKKKL